MSVRWKPLLVLSGLFLVTGVLGVLAFTVRTSAADAQALIGNARAEWKAGRYGNAQIHFLRAKQQKPRDAALHLELAKLCADWAAHEPARRDGLRRERLSALAEAAKFGTDPEPRRLLLLDALDHEDDAQAVDWARKLQEVAREHPDARFALARAALVADPADPGAAEPHVAALAQAEPDRPRTRWLQARLAEVQKQDEALAKALDAARALPAKPGEDLTDRMARLRLAQLDARHAADATARAGAIGTLKAVAGGLVAEPDAPAVRLATVGQVLDAVRGDLAKRADAPPKAELDALADAAEAGYTKALETAAAVDLNIYRDYADHLLDRDRRDRCLELVEKALKQPVAALPAWADTVMRLREVAIKAALLDTADPKRYEKAAPHIKALIASTAPLQQAIGHLFQGVIELDRSGLAGGGNSAASPALRASAVNHLKVAAAGLPDAATPQALYGVALLLTGEPALGRQYLVSARRAADLEPRYRLWCAWAMVQSGYPEEAEADLKILEAAAAQPGAPADLVGSIALLRGEVLQAKGTPQALAAARQAFEAALAAGGARTPALELRLAQLDAALGDPAKALGRVEALRARGDGGPAAELQAIGLMIDAKRLPEARAALDAARKRYPDSAALVLADARLQVDDAKPDAADATLAEFLAKYPRERDVLQARAGLLAGPLKRPDEARKLLAATAETAETSAPLVQLARLDFERGDLDGVAATIAKIRGRWAETAVADLLDAELALRRNDSKGALSRLEAALKKDPSNKLALFWKAQIEDARAGGAGGGATAAVYEALAREGTSKEIDEGLSLAAAARWALASQALQGQDVDGAIARYDEILKDPGVSAEIARSVRWKLVAARAAKGQWAAAKPEMENLLRDKGTTVEEWVRAANFYRVNGEPNRTAEVLDGVLRKNPGYPPAVAIRAYQLATDKPADAAALIRQGIAAAPQPPSLYLMLAGIENKLPPKDTGVPRALAAIAEGLKAHAGSTELIKGRYLLLRLSGDPSAALASVQEAAKTDQTGQVARLLVELLREEGRLDDAAKALAEQVAAQPKDPALAWSLVQLTAARAAAATNAGDKAKAAALDAETLAAIKRGRAAFPDDLAFLQAECEHAARHREFDRALALTKELDRLDPKSPAGPALRGQIARLRNAPAIAADEFAEAVQRAPRRLDLRLALGQAALPAGKADEAIAQAEFILQNRADGDAAAILLKARALAAPAATPGLAHDRRQQAIKLLQAAVAKAPTFAAGAHLLAEIQLQDGDRAGAVKTLADALARAEAQRKQRPEAADELATGLSLAVQALAEPRPDGTPAPKADLDRADALARQYAGDDATGELALAASMGYQRAGQMEPARTWGEAATKALPDDWVAHLNLGDILLAQAEASASSDSPAARDLFERAVAAYDKVLAQNPDSIEATNNKAWVLHQYLDRDDDALKLCEALVRGASPEAIPADLWDTLGSIYEALRRPKEAEAAYNAGLKRDGDHAVLNFHLGRLLAADRARAGLAASLLRKADSARDGLTPAMADELKALLARADR